MAAAPNIPVQIAHMSSGFQQPDALREFAEARASKDPRARNLYFDLSVGSFANLAVKQGRFLAEMIRKIGVEHVLYASDELPGDHHAPTWKHWLEMRQNLPLTNSEFCRHRRQRRAVHAAALNIPTSIDCEGTKK